MNNKIGFSNFRKFANFPEIDLGDITILVGGNNSGKSTLVKAFLLCVDNLRMMRMSDRRRKDRIIFGFNKPMFRFDANIYHDVKVKTFTRAIHNKPVPAYDGSDASLPSAITFKFALGKFEFQFVVAGNRNEELTYGDVQSIFIVDKEQNIRFCNDYEHNTMSYAVLASSQNDGSKKVAQDTSKKEEMRKEYLEIDNALEEATNEGDLERIASLSEEKEKIEAAYKATYGIDVTLVGELEVVNLEDDAPLDLEKDSVCYDNLPLGFVLDEVNEYVVMNVISNIINFASQAKDKTPEYKEGEDSDSYDEKMKEYEAKEDARKGMYLDISKMHKSRKDLAYLLETLNVQYISAHAVNQDAFYKRGGDDFMAQVVYDFYFEKIIHGEIEYTFITDWMKTFGIGYDFCIEPLMAGDVYKLTIEDEDGTKLPLADKGMGAIQMMILLLRLATIMHIAKSNKSAATTVVIEEPEQNLHPKMQSLLADLLQSIATSNEYKVNFIIETHSEYLIRKSQVLVAQEKHANKEDLTANNPFKIYYLPSDGSDRYEMEYRTDGCFANDFGEGFFDEAENLAFQVL